MGLSALSLMKMGRSEEGRDECVAWVDATKEMVKCLADVGTSQQSA